YTRAMKRPSGGVRIRSSAKYTAKVSRSYVFMDVRTSLDGTGRRSGKPRGRSGAARRRSFGGSFVFHKDAGAHVHESWGDGDAGDDHREVENVIHGAPSGCTIYGRQA